MRTRWMFMAPLAMLGFLVFIAVGGLVVLLLWNWLLPPLFGWHTIDFWRAFGLLLLCRILFGGLGWRRFGRPGPWTWRGRYEECGSMFTPEEREQFRQRVRERIRERMGFGPAPGENKGQGT